MNKSRSEWVLVLVAFLLFGTLGRAGVLVNDTWLDGTRSDPASPTYSENGTDADFDGNLESAWFHGNSGTMTASVGHLITTNVGSSSSSWTTYFTPEGSEATLATAGDQLKVTWVFTPTGVNASNTSQNFRLGVANAPSRLTSDGSPPTAAYVGYAMFMNFGQTFNHARPFELRERIGGTDFLASSGDWGSLTSGGTSGNTGYASGTQYTFVMTFTRTASAGLDIVATVTGGSINDSGSVTASFTDTTPNSFAFDMVGMRPSGATTTANQFDTTLFKVEVIPAATPPSINQQPTNLTVNAGETGTFSVSAAGSAPLRYQWFMNTNTVLNLATNTTLTIPNAQITNAGAYSVVVSNSYGTLTSSYATLSVNTNPVAPTFTIQPASQFALVGDTTTFTATASGTQPITYQWTKNTASISGATATSLVLTNLQNSDAANYAVIASNSAGVATSSNATLTVTNTIPGDLYVSPTGLVGNPGTIGQPTTLSNAISTIPAGNTIWMRGGTYTFSEQMTIISTNSGIFPTTRKKIFAYPGEKPVLDFSSEPYTGSSDDRGIKINGHLWHLKGLEVYRSSDSGIYISGKSNIVELCVAHHNRDTGIQLGRQGSSTPQADWPSDNLFLNCDSYDNYDEPPGTGENADGFACKLTTGPGNVFRGCISHNNIDDGWDLFTKADTGPIDPVIIDQCISYNNGTLSSGTFSSAGDRNGFKLGGEDIPVIHTVTRCIAFGNGKNGFAFNSNPAAHRIINNAGWNNIQGNYKFDVAGPIFYNNLSFYTSGSGVNDRYGGNAGIATGPSNIFWFNGATKNDASLTVSSSSFQSLTVPGGGFTRNADGSPNLGTFAKLVNGSPLINAGTLPPTNTVTLPYDASAYYEGAPDLGAIEIHTATVPSILTDPVSQTVLIGSNVTFTASASGTAPLFWQWLKNSSTVADATNATFVIPSAQPSDAGQYSVIVSNSAGTDTSNPATLSVFSAFQFWQLSYFGSTNNPSAQPGADSDGDGMNNEAEFLSGSDPTNSVSALRIISAVPQNNDVLVTWQTVGGHTNAVQATSGDGNGGYSTNFSDVSGPIVLPGSVTMSTNYIDAGGATNVPSRYYRIRLIQ